MSITGVIYAIRVCVPRVNHMVLFIAENIAIAVTYFVFGWRQGVAFEMVYRVLQLVSH